VGNKKKILVLTSTFPRWEGDREPPFIFELATRLAEQFDVLALAPHAPGAAIFEEIGSIKVYRFRYFFNSWQTLAYDGGIMANLKLHKWRYILVPCFVLSELFSLIQLIRKHKIDVIHAHWLIPQGVVAVAARALTFNKKPAILCTAHGSDVHGLNGIPFDWLKKLVIHYADKLTTVSTAMQQQLSHLMESDAAVIPMGADLIKNFHPPLENGRNSNEILFVGRLVEGKGVHHLITAMQEIIKGYPNATLTIAGDGPIRKELVSLAESLGVIAHTQFVGAVDHSTLKNLYGRAAIFASASLAEGLGLVFVEALGCECPVVATDLPAIRDVVIDGVTGLVCKRNDSRDLAHKILSLLNHPETRRELGRAGRQHVLQYFDWQIVSRRYRDLIENMARNPDEN
jgi:glycosyltransferase involved in cell wall biosynthesis